MATKTIGGKRWNINEEDESLLTRTEDDKTLKVRLAPKQGFTACGAEECDYYRPIRSDCPVCGKAKPEKSSTSSTAKSIKGGAISDDDVKLITSLVLAAQLGQYPTKPERAAPTAGDFAGAVKENNEELLKELADLQGEWEKYQSYSSINTRILNRYKGVIDSVIGSPEE